MGLEEIAFTLRCLAEGKDPETGLAPAPPDVLDRPDVIRALFSASMLIAGEPADAKQVRPPRTGHRWTQDEDEQLKEAVAAGHSIRRIANALDRSPYGVEVRLAKLGLPPAGPRTRQAKD